MFLITKDIKLLQCHCQAAVVCYCIKMLKMIEDKPIDSNMDFIH